MIDTTAHEDASITTNNNASVGSIPLFQSDANYQNVGSTELNHSILNGGFTNASDTYKIPFWSNTKSNANCLFASNPSINIQFDEAHTSNGLTLKFLNDYPTEITIDWYFDTAHNIKILTRTFYPTSTNFFCREQVENFKGIRITFKKTRLPYQYIKATFIMYGQVVTWSDEQVISATVNEEIDVTSATIPINTAEITLLDEQNEFNIQNDNGLWKSLQNAQKVVLTEFVNGSEIDVGTFFIDGWDSKDNSITVKLIDAIGLIDKTKFDGGIYNGNTAQSIVNAIMTSARYDDYELAEDCRDMLLKGHLPIQSHRSALQQVAFSLGAVIDCSRGSTIRIYKPDRNIDSYILRERKFSGQSSVNLTEYVSGVQITAKAYSLNNAEEKKAFSGTLEQGRHRVEFNRPYVLTRYEGCTRVSSHVNYAIIDVATSGNVTIYGKEYDETESTVTKQVEMIEVGQNENIKSFKGITLTNLDNLSVVADALLKWYLLRQNVNIEYICGVEKVGEWVGIQDNINPSKYAIARINKQKINLTGGYLATAECVGYSTEVSSYAYMGNGELRMSGEELI